MLTHPHRFITTLTSAKIYSGPLPIDKLSELFQDFYVQAESHISTHIQILSSRQYRDASPAPSISSRASARLNSKASKDSLKRVDSADTGQKMLTPNEISERRRARRLLEHKRVALEEAIERRVCEGIYDRIWRHKSTLDDIRDEKLRSKTEALGVVGIGLKDLGIEFSAKSESKDATASREMQVEESIAKAGQGLLDMNSSHNPLGKLQGLASTHQAIVDFLANLHQSSSSADEILPTLIYTLIRSPAEQVNAVSNLNFIQRFRSSNKINGEAAYCLTNLEAAITFLETVDLATLRAEEAIDSASKPSTRGRTVPAESLPASNLAASTTAATTASPVTTSATARPLVSSPTKSKSSTVELNAARPPTSSSPSHQRHLSSLFQPPSTAFSSASDAVLSTADESFRNIKGTLDKTLDSSFKLLFGRLKEQHVKGTGTDHGAIIVPKTLDEARRMVSPKAMVDEDGTISESSSFAEQEDGTKEDRLLDMIAGSRAAGAKTARDRSVDSAGSGSGSRRVLFAADSKIPAPSSNMGLGVSPPAVSASAAVESMRNLGNSLNPLNRFSGMNVMRGFGRTNSSGASPPVSSPAVQGDQALEQTSVGPESAGILGKEMEAGKIGQPIQRFVELGDARELKVGEVEVLLKDYQRLAQVLRLKGLI